jgi:3-oxoadipate enol-lactonase
MLGDIADVMAPDLRGFGTGDQDDVPEVMLMETYALDLMKLADERSMDSVVLCGLSMGGYIAMAFLELFPDRVKGLILCNTKAAADDEEAKLGRYKVAEQAFDPGVPVIARGMLPKMLSERTRREREDVARYIEMMMARQRPEAVAAAAQGMALRHDRRDWLKQVKVPTLIITGSEDALMDTSTSKEMNDAIDGSRLEVIEGAGHLSNVDQPERFNALVREFLMRIED